MDEDIKVLIMRLVSGALMWFCFGNQAEDKHARYSQEWILRVKK